MFKMLIIDDNIFYVKNLVNLIGNKIDDIRICSVATSGYEALNLLSNENYDIILLDLQMPNINGLELLNSLSNLQQQHYKNSVIVVSGEMDLITKANENEAVYGYFVKGNSTDELINKINKIIKEKNNSILQNEIMQRIVNEVQFLGYNISYKGTKYIIEAIYYILNNIEMNYDNLTKSIYPILAKKYNKTVTNIKMNISKATDIMYYECQKERLNEYFKFYSDYKPKPKLVINTIVGKIYSNK